MIATSGIRDEKKNEYKEEMEPLREDRSEPEASHLLKSLQFLFNLGGADDDLYRLYDYVRGGDSTASFHSIYGADGDSIHVNIHIVAELY